MHLKNKLRGFDFNIISIVAMGLAAAAAIVGDYDKDRKCRAMIKDLVKEEIDKRMK